MIERMADRLFEAMSRSPLDPRTAALLRLDPLRNERKPDVVTFSGGVSEYLYARETRGFGDLGALLARAILERVRAWGPRIERSDEGIRATVIGASQYTVQVSGSTIFVEPRSVLPLRNVPVIAPDLPLSAEAIDADRGRARRARRAQAPRPGFREQTVAAVLPVEGIRHLRAAGRILSRVAAGMATILGKGLPLVLVGDGDVGGLIGIHCREEIRLSNPVVSVDGIALKEFDSSTSATSCRAPGRCPW